MKSTRARISVGRAACMTLSIMSLCSVSAHAAIPDSGLTTPISDNFVSASGGEFTHLCATQNRPCGIEENHCLRFWKMMNTRTPKKSRFKKMTFSKALDEITRLYPDYRWQVRDNVVNLEPTVRSGPDLLSRKLDKVSIHGVISRDAFNLVLGQAGIQISNGITYGQPRSYGVVDLEIKDVTVREALNAIAKADGQVLWEFGPDKPESSVACFRALSWRTSGGRWELDRSEQGASTQGQK